MAPMAINPSHLFTIFAFSTVFLLVSNQVACADAKNIEIKVGVVVNMEEVAGKKTLNALELALSDFYAAHPEFKTRLVLQPRTSQGDIVTSASAVLSLIKNEQVKSIIGPETSMEAEFDISLCDKAHVPIISYSATNPFLSSVGSHYFIQATQVDSAQVQAISSLIQALGWQQVTPVYVDNDFGGGIMPSLIDALQQIGTRIPSRCVISALATDEQLAAHLYELQSRDTRVFIVHMKSDLGVRLFTMANKLGMMSQDYVWIITNGIGNYMDTITTKNIMSMQGVVGVQTYFPQTEELENFTVRWTRKLRQENINMHDAQITVFDLWAYDAITALARAVEQVGHLGFAFSNNNFSSNASTSDLSTVGVLQGGQALIRAIKGSRFIGLSGDFNLDVHGQLQSSVLEIINVIGRGYRTVGLWTPVSGFEKEMDSSGVNSSYSISKENLKSITWPGDNKDPPKGWVIPTNEKKLRVLVSVKDGFEQFVKVTFVPGSSKPKFTGYCIDLFDAVMQSLPYPVPYEYFHLIKPGHSATTSYDELITQVYYKRYDAIVGDVTIITNRSLYVDFALPYVDSSTVMIAPVKDNNINWVFIKPLSLDLWITSFCYFFFFAFVIWVLEHPINPQFRGPAEHQVGASLYYSFSTLVSANSEHVFSNMARFVAIILLFFAFILSQSYTASFASMLTVKQLQPTVTDVNTLIKTRKAVGYQEGSFVKDLLIRMGFKPNHLKPYTSVEQLHHLFKKGEIAAVFDEMPYVNVFLAAYCSKFTMVPPYYKNDGFAFAFQLGSPLVADVSRQVLNVTEGDHPMKEITRKWFGDQASCPELSSSSVVTSSSNQLTLESFRELFIIAGVIVAFVLIVFVIRFLYAHRQVWLHRDPNVSAWCKTVRLARIFHQKNMEPRSFEMGRSQSPSSISSRAVATLPSRISEPPSPVVDQNPC